MARVVVIGGGVVGISSALSLIEEGHSVTVVEPGPVGAGASWASCACIAVGEVVPLSQPGTLRKAPGWLMNPEGPLALRPASALRLLPWFARFVANARPARMRAIAEDLATLTFRATADFKAQIARYGLSDLLVERPILKLFDTDRDKASMAPAFALARDLGCTIDEITGAEAHEMEPAIAPDFGHAAVLRDWSYVTDCVQLVARLMRAFAAAGGEVVEARAAGFTREGQRLTGVRLDHGAELPCDDVVLAAGTGARALARSLGLSLPMEGLMGYWTGLPNPGMELGHCVFYPEGGFGITPQDQGIAIAGTVEFASENAAPNWRRADVLVERARRVLPGLNTEGGERRMGRRPFMPDTRAVIGRSGRIANLIFATGHGQLGLTLGATTGRMVADLVAGRTTDPSHAAYSPSRFNL